MHLWQGTVKPSTRLTDTLQVMYYKCTDNCGTCLGFDDILRWTFAQKKIKKYSVLHSKVLTK